MYNPMPEEVPCSTTRIFRYTMTHGSLDGFPMMPKVQSSSIEFILDESVRINKRRYHTSHLYTGFIFEFLGQLNSVANSGRFESGPITLYLGGL